MHHILRSSDMFTVLLVEVTATNMDSM